MGKAPEIPKPLCVFCSKPWTDEMVQVSASAELEHGYYPGEIDGCEIDTVIDVICSSCDRLVYRKECRTKATSWW